MTKPSTWTPQEAWKQSAHAHRRTWDVCAGMPILPFPPDPVERVSDDELTGWTEDGMMRPVRLMALELIERRKADRDPSVVGQHGEKR